MEKSWLAAGTVWFGVAATTDPHGRTSEPETRGRPVSGQPLDILILGPVPPPFGGVSIHLDRLVPILEEAGLDVGVLNHFSSTDRPFVLGALRRNPLRYFWMPQRHEARLVHYHHARWLHLLAFALRPRDPKSRYLATFHGRGILKHVPAATSRMTLMSRATEWALDRFDTVIVVNSDVAARLRDRLAGKRVEVIPAFVGPGRADLAGEQYEEGLEQFLSSGPTLVVAAYGIQPVGDGRDLYGLDLVVDAFAELAGEWPTLRLAVFVARRPRRPRARRRLAALERGIAEAGIGERVYIAYGRPLVPALRSDVVFVRPSRADGDAVSIREALQAGVPVVASDVVERPDGAVLFRTGDRAALTSALRAVIERAPSQHQDDPGTPLSDDPFSAQLIEVYRRELAMQRRDAAP
jgi:glycosyltransferase involved in cell wall biosynthesis